MKFRTALGETKVHVDQLCRRYCQSHINQWKRCYVHNERI